jgi:hypothetical protein
MKLQLMNLTFIFLMGVSFSNLRADNLPPLPPPNSPFLASKQAAPVAHPYSLYFFGGGTTTDASYETEVSPGYNGGIGLGVDLSKLFSLIFNVRYYSLPVNPDYYKSNWGAAVSGGGEQDLAFLINVKFKFLAQDNPVVPYVLFGTGMHLFNLEGLTTTYPNGGYPFSLTSPADSGAGFALLAGIGMDIKLMSQTYLFIQGDWNGVGNKEYQGYNFESFDMGLKYEI